MITIDDFKTKATNPAQYDSPELNWEIETENSPFRKFFADLLEKNLENLTMKNVLDIGSGTGYLSKLFTKLGATDIYGVEPSKDNVEVSNKLYPEMSVTLSSFENFSPQQKFDVAISVMVFEHIDDPASAFQKIFDILGETGHFYLITTDIGMATTPRFDYEIKIQELENGEVATETKRPNGVMYDIARPVKNYIEYSEKAGFKFLKDIPQTPTDELIAEMPKYAEFKNTAISHLLIFGKK